MPSIVYLNNVANFTGGEKKLVSLLGVYFAWSLLCTVKVHLPSFSLVGRMVGKTRKICERKNLQNYLQKSP